MTIPKVLRIMGKLFTVELVSATEIEGKMGWCNGSLQKIKIAQEYPSHMSTLLHEIIEALDYLFELKLSHPAVSTLEEGLFQVFEDNGMAFGGPKVCQAPTVGVCSYYGHEPAEEVAKSRLAEDIPYPPPTPPTRPDRPPSITMPSHDEEVRDSYMDLKFSGEARTSEKLRVLDRYPRTKHSGDNYGCCSEVGIKTVVTLDGIYTRFEGYGEEEITGNEDGGYGLEEAHYQAIKRILAKNIGRLCFVRVEPTTQSGDIMYTRLQFGKFNEVIDAIAIKPEEVR